MHNVAMHTISIKVMTTVKKSKRVTTEYTQHVKAIVITSKSKKSFCPNCANVMF